MMNEKNVKMAYSVAVISLDDFIILDAYNINEIRR